MDKQQDRKARFLKTDFLKQLKAAANWKEVRDAVAAIGWKDIR